MKQNIETGLLLFYLIGLLLALGAAILVILPDRIREIITSVESKNKPAKV